MKWVIVALLLVASCAEAQDAATEELLSQKETLIASLEEKVTALNAKVEDLANKNQELDAAIAEESNLQQMVKGQQQALDDYATDLATCEQKLAEQDERVEELERKTTVLQRWVDACQETLGELG